MIVPRLHVRGAPAPLAAASAAALHASTIDVSFAPQQSNHAHEQTHGVGVGVSDSAGDVLRDAEVLLVPLREWLPVRVRDPVGGTDIDGHADGIGVGDGVGVGDGDGVGVGDRDGDGDGVDVGVVDAPNDPVTDADTDGVLVSDRVSLSDDDAERDSVSLSV